MSEDSGMKYLNSKFMFFAVARVSSGSD